MKSCRFAMVAVVVAAMLCARGAPAEEPIHDEFGAVIDPFFVLLDGWGTGWPGGPPEGGEWFWYETTEWWNQWFYDHPPTAEKWKQIWGSFVVEGGWMLPFEVWNVVVAINYTSPLYPSNPDEPPVPPLEPVDEANWIVREIIFDWASDAPEVLEREFYFAIPDWNPEWVSIDIWGNDVVVYGEIYHQCVPTEGIKFSVHDEPLGTLQTIGMAATGVNWNANNDIPSLEADVYEGAAGTNWIVILKERLGLQDGDDIDALAIADATEPTAEDILLGPELLTWHFSVDPASTGVQGVPPDVFSQQSRNEAAGDVFVTLPPVLGANMLAIDDWWIGLDDTTAPLPEDDQDALDLVEEPDLLWDDPLPGGMIVFSLTADSPSLGGGSTGASLFINNGAGGFDEIVDEFELGIPGEDLDALAMSIEGLPVFSVAPGGPNGLDPADLLVPDNMVAPDPDSLADTLIPAAGLGLVPDHDNVNSLDVRYEPVIVEDTDGDGLPDWWEDENDFDPGDDDDMGDDGEEGSDGTPDGDNDWDGDGFTNQEEYDAGSDPRDPRWTPEIHYTPLTGAFTAAILALVIGVLGYRKRRA